MDHDIIQQVLSLGFRVYMRNRSDRYFYFTRSDGTGVGYLQLSSLCGVEMSTVHRPNRTTGTGHMLGVVRQITVGALEQAFAFAPPWATQKERESIVKYKDIEEYNKVERGLPPLVEVTLQDLAR